MSTQFPILEFDPDRDAIINPRKYGMEEPVPERGVLCFFGDVINQLVEKGELLQIGHFRSELAVHPVYRMKREGGEIFVMHPGVGAPLAAGLLEEIICWGVKNVVVCGGCGVLNPDIAAGHIVMVDSAVRDEGTSYHNLPAAREAKPSQKITYAIVKVIDSHDLPYRLGKTWTTDAIYRETRQRREMRVQEGCAVVEMEAAALFAVAEFRSIEIGMLVYGGDLVIPGGWDSRDWYKRQDDRKLLFDLAIEACLSL